MAGSSSFLVISLVLLIFKAGHGEAIPCPVALTELVPCVPFLTGSGPDQPGSVCCNALQNVLQSATTTQDRKQLCECLKQAAASSRIPIKIERAKQLPELCHVQVPFPIDPNADCSSISVAAEPGPGIDH